MNTPFAKAIVLREGRHISNLSEALAFIESLAPQEVTPSISYARIMLTKAIRSRTARDRQVARSELARAFRAEGWL
jgi:hypothetical protein